MQNQLTLRVKPMMRMAPPRMRSLEDEIDEGSSPELREAKVLDCLSVCQSFWW